MKNQTWWWQRRGGVVGSLRRDIDDLVEAFEPPPGFRRELDRVLSSELSQRKLWRELESLLSDFGSPPSLRLRLRRLVGEHHVMEPLPIRERLTQLLERAALPMNLFRRSGEILAGGIDVDAVRGRQRSREIPIWRRTPEEPRVIPPRGSRGDGGGHISY